MYCIIIQLLYNTKVNYGMDTMEEKENRTSKKNAAGRSARSHENQKFRARSMEKHGRNSGRNMLVRT